MNKLLHVFASLVLAIASLVAQAADKPPGGIVIDQPFARSTAPGQVNGGAYLRLDNRGLADRLLSASTSVAENVELHTSRMEGDVMRMRQLDSIDIPARQEVTLQPGGMHLMLKGLKVPLKAGDSFPLTLQFEKAGAVTVVVKVLAPDAGSMKR